MNLLTEKPTNEIAGYKIKTDFQTWVKLHIALKKKDKEYIVECFLNVFDPLPKDPIKALASYKKVIEWLRFEQPKKSVTPDHEAQEKPKQSYCFEFDGNIIWAELWRFFPDKMARGLEYHDGVQLISYICGMPREQSQLAKRAFARCGDFSKMGKEEQRYWQEMKELYRIPLAEAEQEEINAIAEILKGDGDLSKLGGKDESD